MTMLTQAVILDLQDEPSAIPQETFGRTSANSPETAASFIRRIQETDRTRKAAGGPIISERDALLQWARESGFLVSSSYIEDRVASAEIIYRDEGVEHVVYHDRANARAVKITRPAFFGPVLEYLDRMLWVNELFGDDLVILGVCGVGISAQIITSQKWIAEDEDVVAITRDEIDHYFKLLNFLRFTIPPDFVAYYNQDIDVVALDAHAGNFMRFEGRLVPIDVKVGRSDSESQPYLEAFFRNDIVNAPKK